MLKLGKMPKWGTGFVQMQAKLNANRRRERLDRLQVRIVVATGGGGWECEALRGALHYTTLH
jgi:hypothetical protein